MFVDYLSTLLVFTACDHVVSLVLTCLDYGNGMLAGVASNQLDLLQSMMNVTSRLVCSAGKSDHITPLLRILHWLRVPQRIEFKLAVLVFHCLYGMAPPYLVRELCCVADMDCHHRLHSTSTLELHWLDVPDRVLFKLAVTVHQCLNGLATVSAGPKNPFFVSRRTTCYGRRTTCLVREDKVCPPSLSKRPTKLATNICQIWICPAWQVNSYC